MQYRKFKADYLFTGEQLLTGGQVLITDDAGNICDILQSSDAGADIEIFKGIICPGFINAHCHTELSHLKNVIPEKTGLVDFVFKVVSERHFAEEEILDAIRNAEEEMLKNGIIAVGDICNNSLSAGQKLKRHLHYYNFIEASGWLPQMASLRFEKAKIIFDEFIKNNFPASLVPHAPYSVSESLWQLMIPLFQGKTITIHNQESPDEDLFFMEGKGEFTRMYEMMKMDNSFYQAGNTRSVENYFEKFSSAASVILVHNTFTQQQDIDFIKSHTHKEQLVSFCLCPNANKYIENAVPPVDLFIKNSVLVILGTDSLASNHQLSILEEIKTIVKKISEPDTATLLQWATINGARALQMDDVLGSFAKNKKPGVLLIENTANAQIHSDSKVRRLL